MEDPECSSSGILAKMCNVYFGFSFLIIMPIYNISVSIFSFWAHEYVCYPQAENKTRVFV